MKTQLTRFGALAVLLAATAAPAFAQDAKADEVLAKTRKAIGDRKVAGLKTLSIDATMERNVGSMQMSGDVELLLELPDKYVKTEALGRVGMTMNSGFNGDKAILPSGPNVSIGPGGSMTFRMGGGGAAHAEETKPTREQLEQINTLSVRNSRTEISRMMLGWLGMAHPALKATYTYAGEAESPDGKAHVIDVKNADGFAARLFIDQNNHFPLMVTYQARAPRVMTSGGPMVTRRAAGEGQAKELSEEDRKKLMAETTRTMEQQMAEQPLVEFSLFFDDWREVDGITFPHKMRRASAGETTEEWTFNKVKVNPKLDASKFAVAAAK